MTSAVILPVDDATHEVAPRRGALERFVALAGRGGYNMPDPIKKHGMRDGGRGYVGYSLDQVYRKRHWGKLTIGTPVQTRGTSRSPDAITIAQAIGWVASGMRSVTGKHEVPPNHAGAAALWDLSTGEPNHPALPDALFPVILRDAALGRYHMRLRARERILARDVVHNAYQGIVLGEVRGAPEYLDEHQTRLWDRLSRVASARLYDEANEAAYTALIYLR